MIRVFTAGGKTEFGNTPTFFSIQIRNYRTEGNKNDLLFKTFFFKFTKKIYSCIIHFFNSRKLLKWPTIAILDWQAIFIPMMSDNVGELEKNWK